VLREPRRGEVPQCVAAVLGDLGQVHHPFADVRRYDLDAHAAQHSVLGLLADHRQRVGLLAGRAGGRPYPEPVAPSLGYCRHLRQGDFLECLDLRRVAPEAGLVGGHFVEQELELLRPVRALEELQVVPVRVERQVGDPPAHAGLEEILLGLPEVDARPAIDKVPQGQKVLRAHLLTRIKPGHFPPVCRENRPTEKMVTEIEGLLSIIPVAPQPGQRTAAAKAVSYHIGAALRPAVVFAQVFCLGSRNRFRWPPGRPPGATFDDMSVQLCNHRGMSLRSPDGTDEGTP